MAKDLSLASGIGSDAGYLNGNIKDGQTVVNEHINQDIVQYFQKLMDIAGISANGDFDNEANGYQFVEALWKFIESQHNNWINVPDAHLLNGWEYTSLGPTGYFQFRKTASNKVEIRCNIASGTQTTIWTVPVQYRPAKEQFLGLNSHNDTPNSVPGIIRITPSGALNVARNTLIAGGTTIGMVGFSVIYSLD